MDKYMFGVAVAALLLGLYLWRRGDDDPSERDEHMVTGLHDDDDNDEGFV